MPLKLHLGGVSATSALLPLFQDLLPLFARIDELVKRLPCGTDPMLLDYLRKKNCEKRGSFCRDAMGKPS
jgi:hypothetical protein